MDPTRMRFSQQARKLVEDDKNRGLNCRGCLFNKQPAAVCRLASEVAEHLGLRDCDAVDQFGDVVIYIPYREVQMNLLGEGSDELEST